MEGVTPGGDKYTIVYTIKREQAMFTVYAEDPQCHVFLYKLDNEPECGGIIGESISCPASAGKPTITLLVIPSGS